MTLMPDWDARYNTAEYVYGTAPNDFLVSVTDRLPRGRALCLAEGEGRNAVYLAERGWRVTAVDASAVGLEKARALAEARGVAVDTVVADLADYAIASGRWDVITAIFAHLEPAVRARVHAAVVRGLKPGGALVLEAYTPEQLSLKTGGPPTETLMMRVDTLRTEFAGLKLAIARERRRELQEGPLHRGIGAVAQVLGYKDGSGTGH